MKFGDDITKKLKAMRESYGLMPYDFTISPELIDEIIDPQKITELFDNESHLLIHKGIPVFVYIRDHSVGVFSLTDPFKLNKIHFTVCKTLIDMKKGGRFGRYQITNRDDGQYIIERHKRETHDVHLYPCQNCLHELHYKGFSLPPNKWMSSWQNTSSLYMSDSERKNIVKTFDARETINYIRKYFRDFTDGQRRDFQTSGYPKNWKAISYHCRKNKIFTCDECKVNLSNYPHLTDCHHVNHVKSDCRDDNLSCLCKECHAKLHHHYKPSGIEIIQQERNRQNRTRVGTG